MVSGISSQSSFSTASISEMMQQMFNKVDTNSDGAIDENEMSSLIRQATSSIIDVIFSKQNADQKNDQDSLTSLIESNSSLAKLGQEMKSGDGLLAVSGTTYPFENGFDMSDTNKNGFVSKDELSAVTEMKGADIDKLFSKFDTDCDGLISRTEYETFQKQMTEETQQNEFANSSTNDISDFGRNWLSVIFETLLKGITTASGTSSESTSIHA